MVEDIVKGRVGSLGNNAKPYKEDLYKVKIRGLGGMDVPLNILFQEIRNQFCD